MGNCIHISWSCVPTEWHTTSHESSAASKGSGEHSENDFYRGSSQRESDNTRNGELNAARARLQIHITCGPNKQRRKDVWLKIRLEPQRACISDSRILSFGENSHCTKFMSTDSWHHYQDPFTFNNDVHIFTSASQCNWMHVIIFKDKYLNPLKNHAELHVRP